MRDLIAEPLWRPEDLGRAIPESPHAVSVCLPTWRDIIGYEEGDPRVLERLRTGYPRFVYNAFCRELFEVCRRRFASASEACHVYPTRTAADRFCSYFRRRSGEPARVCALGIDDVQAVCFPQRLERIAKEYWQHVGEGITSRRAEACLNWPVETGPTSALPILRERIARLAGVSPECVLLFPSGMAATAAVFRALSALFPGRKTVQFGFPYVDTLKIQQKFGSGVHLFPRGSTAELDQLEALAKQEAIGGVLTEFPSNPLLASPDLGRLFAITRQHGCPLVVDETIASFINADVVPKADVVCTSLTKFFSGVGDVMGGALVLNPDGQLFSELSGRLAGDSEDLLWSPDLAVLERNSRNFEERMRGINVRAEQLAEFLRDHPKIDRVYYPKFETPDAFRACQRLGGGYGGLLSLTLRGDAETTPRFFDALRVCKGPNLGMTYTLACPYTILAHYDELEFAESCGVSRYLIRVSVGLEGENDLVARFEDALAQT